MKLCILCEDSKVLEVRNRAKRMFGSESLLKIGLSPNGDHPITHWFCEMDVSERAYNRLLSIQKDSIMELSNRNDFLNKYELIVVDIK